MGLPLAAQKCHSRRPARCSMWIGGTAANVRQNKRRTRFKREAAATVCHPVKADAIHRLLNDCGAPAAQQSYVEDVEAERSFPQISRTQNVRRNTDSVRSATSRPSSYLHRLRLRGNAAMLARMLREGAVCLFAPAQCVREAFAALAALFNRKGKRSPSSSCERGRGNSSAGSAVPFRPSHLPGDRICL
jgi:hypothetical protein